MPAAAPATGIQPRLTHPRWHSLDALTAPLTGRNGRRLTVLAANFRIRRWARLAELPITAHSLRHAFATHLLARGAPLVAIQRLLGHSTMGMTSRYTHLLAVDVQQAVAQHHPRAKKKRGRRPRTQEP